MADKLMRAQVTIPLDGLLPEDYPVNTWHFDGDDAGITPTDAEWGGAVKTLLMNFYQFIDATIFPAQVNSPATLKVYDMRDPEPRVPFHQDTITLTPNTDNMMPGEVALCLSFAATPLSGVNQARRRGRIFLGPIRVGASEIVNSQNRPTSATRTEVAQAADNMLAGVDAVPGSKVKWAIFSPTTLAGGSTIDDAFHDVVSGWVDNAWDTQRRRGCAPTARTLFS